MADWINTEPGVYVLSGTPFKITYDAEHHMPFVMTDNRGETFHYHTLGTAKLTAEWEAGELKEMGLL